jgi:hypothetical protein
MSQLLTDKDRPLYRARRGDSLSTVARARTLTVLTRLDKVRKGSVVQFLSESGLITGNRPILDLRQADPGGADLSDAKGVTNEELERQAKSLEDATMPDGQKYEDWLRSKGSGEDRENTGPS